MAAPICIRAATHRLLTTPAKELPSIATYIATAVTDCGSILSVPQSQKKASRESDNALLVQKLKTRITNLLQDQSVEGRWTGVILVKAMIEAGQWEILRGCESWVRGLLGILGRSDPLSTKKLSLITLTRIFRLTYPYQTLVREITTPSLPTFITSCLNLVSVKPIDGQARQLKRINPLLDTVLRVFLELLPHHPTIFRPFSSQIHGLVLPLIAPFGVSGSLSRSGIRLAQRLFITLHQCAPKNTGGEEWLKACRSTISSVHQTSDHLFRGVVEQWESVDTTLRRPSRPKNYDHPVGDGHPDALGSPTWQVSVTSPSSDDASQCVTDLNPEVGREERESLWAELPRLHIAVLDLLRTIVERLGLGSIPIAQSCLEQTLWIFEAEHSSIHIRIAVYKVLNTLLPIIGPSIIKPGVTPLASIIRFACQDLLPSSTSKAVGDNQPINGKSAAKPNPTTSNVDSFLNINHKANIDTEHPLPGLKSAAADLLTSLLTFLPAEHTPTYLRTEIDRTAIITKNESIMMASVLNPVPATSNGFNTPSIMPFLTRGFSELPGVESFLRPRMPVLVGDSRSNEWEAANGEDDSEPRSVTALVLSSDAVPEELTRPLNKRALDDIQTTDEQPTPPSESQNLLPSHTKRIRVETMQSHSYSHPAAVVAREVVPAEPPKERVTNFDTPAPAIQLTPAQHFNSAATGTEKVEIRNNDGAGEGDGESDDEIPTLNIEPDTDEDDEEGE
ncbi:conserved hypothetical protein [Histoplasma capsulatum H143]|uniref:Pre-rRNA-processing protein RIX1 n=1 Tax=Ajellomyces capsulatus (strain H143) TaxID=544712 RepID=C6HPT1_AJECH|nr:conserved hypothetical protein [Histoplasma capsulatum H143]